jgi:ABC-type Fe3+-hydroxamate transport system substrate-binding protein
MIGRRRMMVLPLAAAPAPALARAEVDSTGRRVVLAAPARRVVAIVAYPAIGTLAALDRHVAGSLLHRTDFLRAVDLFDHAALPQHVGHADWTPDAERIAALRPDLILTYGADHAEILRAIAPTFAVRMDQTIAALCASQLALGRLVGREDAAGRMVKAFTARVADAARRAPTRPSLAVLSLSGRRFWAYGGANVLKEVLGTVADTAAGSMDVRLPWAEVSLEGLHRIDADAILLAHWSSGRAVDSQAMLDGDRLWTSLRAVRHGRVLALNVFEVHTFKCIPTLARLLDLTAALLHPEMFPARPSTGDRLVAAMDF